jgi:hypothetical protein
MTYYKYAERDATSQVNWADVSKKFSDEIIRVGKEREKRRDTIDTATDELVTKINEAPMGQHANANSFTASLVDQTTEDTLRMNKLLKSGDIKPSEYMNYIENQKASVTGLYDMVTDYQSVYTDKMKRMQDGDSLPFEWEGMAAVEGFGNFANTTPVIDMYGNVTMVNDATGETMSVAEQRAITKQYFNAYDIDGAMEKQKDQLGQYLTVEMTGNTKTIDDVRRQDGFIKYMDDLVAETLAGPLATSTILLKDLPGYSTSFSPGDDPNKVLTSILDPRQPGSGAQIPLVEVVEQVEKMSDTERRKIFSENADVEALIRVAKAQREDAKQWAKKDLNFRLDRIETARQEFPERDPSQPSAAEKAGLKKTEIGVTNLQKIWGATTLDELRQAIGYFEGLNNDLKLTVDKIDGVRKLGIKKGDADTKFFDITEDYNGFVEAVSTELLGDVTYVDEAKRLSPLDREKYPTLGKATGSGQRRYIPDRGKIGEELVDLGEEQFTVDAVLQGLGGANTPDGVPVVGGLGSLLGTGMSEADQNALMENAVAGLNVLFSSKLDPQDEVSVRGIVASQASGDYPEVVVTVNGEDRVFSVAEGEFGNLKNYAKELLGKIGQKKAELD